MRKKNVPQYQLVWMFDFTAKGLKQVDVSQASCKAGCFPHRITLHEATPLYVQMCGTKSHIYNTPSVERFTSAHSANNLVCC